MHACRCIRRPRVTFDERQVVFEARYNDGVDRIQFALAGMNARIDHDLSLAFLNTDSE